NVWSAVGAVASAIAFIAADQAGFTPIVCVGVAVLAIPFTGAMNTLTFFAWKCRHLNPLHSRPSPSVALNLTRLGSQFFLLAVVTSVAQNVDTLIVARGTDLATAAQYAVAFKLMTGLVMLVALVNTPLWPLNGEGLARGDTAWVRRMTLV